MGGKRLTHAKTKLYGETVIIPDCNQNESTTQKNPRKVPLECLLLGGWATGGKVEGVCCHAFEVQGALVCFPKQTKTVIYLNLFTYLGDDYFTF